MNGIWPIPCFFEWESWPQDLEIHSSNSATNFRLVFAMANMSGTVVLSPPYSLPSHTFHENGRVAIAEL